ncbi:MAG: hypothetical protein GC136_00080 [Alphaproteobacteria bacterium]|nr:hypothetical protein [Alphaproteobacteria bacterium]
MADTLERVELGSLLGAGLSGIFLLALMAPNSADDLFIKTRLNQMETVAASCGATNPVHQDVVRVGGQVQTTGTVFAQRDQLECIERTLNEIPSAEVQRAEYLESTSAFKNAATPISLGLLIGSLLVGFAANHARRRESVPSPLRG